MSLAGRSLPSSLLFALVLTTLPILAGCPPEYPKCKDDGNCASHGEICVGGLCKECRDDSQCKEGFACQGGACVHKTECDKDDDCKDGLRCRQHKCVPECTSDAQCGSGQKCMEMKCVDKDVCTTDADCPGGRPCEQGRCAPANAVTAPPPSPTSCELTEIHFDFNEFALTSDARAALEKNADCIKTNHRGVIIQGNTDERGTDEYNLVLGEKRADSVRRYLAGLGVNDDSMKTVSYGKERPRDPGHTEAAWATNRRADFVWR